MDEICTELKNDSTLTSPSLVAVQAKTQRYINASTPDNTRRAYRSAIRQFEKWGGSLPDDPRNPLL